MKTIMTLTLDDAKKALDAMEKKAADINANLCFCITDASNNILILEKMDDSKIHSINLSRAKATTALSLKDSTANVGDLIKNWGIETSYWAGACETGFKGGIPVYYDAESVNPIGAIGVSGGTPDEDEEVANFGLKATGFITK